MAYVEIVNLVFTIISGIFAIFYLNFIVFAIIGVLKKKKYPKTQTKLRYGLIIPARNEEKVVGNLIDSIKKSNYPQDKLEIFVIAHNCTDDTAEVCRKYNQDGKNQVHVYEYNNPKECTMGYAFKYLFSQIEKDYGTQTFDGFMFFNADNIVKADYFERMNDAYVANNGEKVITSFRNSKNFGSNVVSGCASLYFLYGCLFEMRGRTVVNCSTRVSGTGYVFNSKIVKDGWNYVDLTEDWDFSADQITSGIKIAYCDEAEFFDEQPTSFKIMCRQRVRWARGHLLVCVTRLKSLLKSVFSKKHKNHFSCYDYTVNCLPIGLVVAGVSVAQIITLCFAPLVGGDLVAAILGFLKSFGWSFVYTYVISLFTAVLLCLLERKRIQNISTPKKILVCLLWPFFHALNIVFDIVALFNRKLVWKPIPHKDTTTFEKLNKKHKLKNCPAVSADKLN